MKKVKTSSKGRRCKFPHCKSILSIYNHETCCHLHLGLIIKEYKQKVSIL